MRQRRRMGEKFRIMAQNGSQTVLIAIGLSPEVFYRCRVQTAHVIGAGGIGVALGWALARAGWEVTMVEVNPQKLKAGQQEWPHGGWRQRAPGSFP